MLSKLYSSAVFGVNAATITIEVNVLQGVKLFISGLPDNAIKESTHRIESAIKELGYLMPRQKVLVNLAPADIKKEGAHYDLPIALGVLQASEQVTTDCFKDYVIVGELSLEGLVLPVNGALPIAVEARRSGFKGLMLPEQNAAEAAVVEGLEVIGVRDIQSAVNHFSGKTKMKPYPKSQVLSSVQNGSDPELDFSEVQGQDHVKGPWKSLRQEGTM